MITIDAAWLHFDESEERHDRSRQARRPGGLVCRLFCVSRGRNQTAGPVLTVVGGKAVYRAE